MKNVIKNPMKYKYMLVVLCAISLSLTGLIYFFKLYIAEPNDNEVLAVINSEPLAVGEFRIVMYKRRANIYSYFNKKYNAEVDKSFWNTSYNGEIPIELIKRQALEKCIEAKIKQLFAVEKGLLPDAGYPTFLRSLNVQNLQRKENKKEGKLIYGPEQYDLQAYYDVFLNKAITDTKNKIKSEQDYSDAELLEYYDKNKDELFKQADTNQLSLVSYPEENKEKSGLAGEYKDFESQKDYISSVLANEEYERIIEDLIKNARVELVDKVYKRIKME